MATVCVFAVNLGNALLRSHILDAELAYEEARLEPLLQGLGGRDRLTRETAAPAPATELPGLHFESVDYVYAAGEPAGLLLKTRIEDGYAGPIRLVVGVRVDGTLTGVQVLEHAETPGLGDRIEPEKSDWLTTFNGRSLANPDRAYWSIARDGGAFDQMTGASITSRAVVRAVRDALIYAAEAGNALFAAAEENAERSLRAVTSTAGAGRSVVRTRGASDADACAARVAC